MPRPPPIVRELRWLYVVPQILALLVCIVTVGFHTGAQNGMVFGSLLYLIYSLASRAILARHHNAGSRRFKRRQWTEALACFERSQAFFERNGWIDRYRQIAMMSPSGATYHEMALINQAACLLHLDRRDDARALFEKARELYPDSPLAEAGLKAISGTLTK